MRWSAELQSVSTLLGLHIDILLALLRRVSAMGLECDSGRDATRRRTESGEHNTPVGVVWYNRIGSERIYRMAHIPCGEWPNYNREFRKDTVFESVEEEYGATDTTRSKLRQ